MSSEPDPFEQPKVSVWRRLLFLSVALAAVLALAGVAHWSAERGRTRARLEELLAELDANESPWRLEEIQDARPVVPEARNSARVIARIHTLLPRGWPDQKFYDRLQDVPTPELLDPERRRLLADEMKAVAPALAEARKLADMPQGRHQLALAGNPINTLLNDQQETRKAAALLQYDAWDRALDGDLKEALRAGRAGINAARSLGDEPFVVSQLIRIACVAVALAGLERSLALGEAAEADLAEVQKLLALEEKHPTLLVCARGERAVMHSIFDQIESGAIPMKDVLDTSWSSNNRDVTWRERLFGVSRAELRREHALALELMTRMVEAAGLPAHEQLAAERGVVREVEERVRASRARLAAILLPPMSTANHASRRKLAQVRCLLALVAVERHRLRHGRWPDKLGELTPALLAEVPLDPYDGKPLRYRRLPDGVVVYSVGEDGVDNGGRLDRARPVAPGTDLGYQLWDVPHRRQPAKPPPKPAEDGGGPP